MLKEHDVKKCVMDVPSFHPLMRKFSSRNVETYYSMIEAINKDYNNSKCNQFYIIQNGEIVEFVPPPRMDS